MSALVAAALVLQAGYAAAVWRLGTHLGRGPRLAPRDGAEAPPAADGAGTEAPASFTVVVPARNEAAALPGTLAALAAQTLSLDRWELLVVDDGSRDGTADAARRAMAALTARGGVARVLETAPEARGKKAAITLGARSARHPWVAVLDADSRPGPCWLEALAAAARPGDGLLAAPVLFGGGGLWACVVRLEYLGLLGAGLASFAAGRALFASGANLAWRRAAFHEAGGYAGLEHVPSADDTLLVQRLRLRTRWRLAALLDPAAAVESRGPAGWRALWRQRVRWTSSERHLPDRVSLAAALALYVVFLQTALALAGAFPAPAALALLLLKALPDARLVRRAALALDEGRLLPLLPLAWLLQLAYGLAAPWAGTFGRVAWRGEAAVVPGRAAAPLTREPLP